MPQYIWLRMSRGGLDMEHVPGQLDFRIEGKEFPVTVFRRKISSVWDFVETPGHVAIITRKGKRECALIVHRDLCLHVR